VNPGLKKRLAVVLALYVVALCGISWAFTSGHLSGRNFGIAGVVLAALFVCILTVLFQKQRNANANAPIDARRQALKRGETAYRRLIIMFACFMVFGALATTDLPTGIRIFGCLFDLLLIALFYRSMKRLQAQLKDFGETE
jgi:Ca2+/Na+ antiporter